MKTKSDDTLDKIADYLAKELFKLGNEPGRKCRRIQFMCGPDYDHEKPGGGLIEPALASCIKRSLSSLIIKSLGRQTLKTYARASSME